MKQSIGQHDFPSLLPEKVSLFGVDISAVDLFSATDEILRWCEDGEKHYVTVVNVHTLTEAQNSPHFRDVLNESGMAVPDGMPIVWLAHKAGAEDVERVVGVELMEMVSAKLAEQGGSAFYYGGEEGVAEEVAESLEHQFPGLKTAGTYCPPFRDLTKEEEENVLAMINQSKPDVVWVAIGAPRQEWWMSKMLKQSETNAMVGVGAAFNFITGKIHRAPRWMQRAGLEWAYRLYQEPQRLFMRYLVTNTQFAYLILKQFVKGEELV